MWIEILFYYIDLRKTNTELWFVQIVIIINIYLICSSRFAEHKFTVFLQIFMIKGSFYAGLSNIFLNCHIHNTILWKIIFTQLYWRQYCICTLRTAWPNEPSNCEQVYSEVMTYYALRTLGYVYILYIFLFFYFLLRIQE